MHFKQQSINADQEKRFSFYMFTCVICVSYVEKTYEQNIIDFFLLLSDYLVPRSGRQDPTFFVMYKISRGPSPFHIFLWWGEM